MKHHLAFAIACATLLPATAFAHKAWLMPSQTVIAGEKAVITVDGAVSNDLFYFNHVPLNIDNLVITAPDGSKVEAQNKATSKYRNIFDVELTQDGTYRIGTTGSGLMATWEEAGKPKRWRGNAATFATEVPKDAKNLQVSQTVNRVQTFVTKGSPNETALALEGNGIELVPVTHPNDLFAGEEATFKFVIDRKPAKDLEITIIEGGTRYRNAQNEIKVKTDSDGQIKVKFPEAGMYWLQTDAEDNATEIKEAKKRRLNYVATLEVLPQ